MKERTPLGPYRQPMNRVLGGSEGGGHFLMGEVPLHLPSVNVCVCATEREERGGREEERERERIKYISYSCIFAGLGPQ